MPEKKSLYLMAAGLSLKDVNKIRYGLGLGSNDYVLEKNNSSANPWAIYVKEPGQFAECFSAKFTDLEHDARSRRLVTNVGDIKKKIDHEAKKEIDNKIEETQKEKYIYFTYAGLAESIRAEVEEDDIVLFKRRYMATAIDILSVVKLIFPKSTHHRFVNILKDLKIKKIEKHA